MKKLDKSLLPPGFRTDKTEDGFCAEFYEDGQLSHYGYYKDGELDDRWSLTVEEGTCAAYAQRLITLDYAPEDEEVNHNHHGHSEPTDEEQEDFLEFIEYWIERIHDDAASPLPRCSFCEKASSEVEKLIAGPTTYICNECVTFCQEILAEEETREQ